MNLLDTDAVIRLLRERRYEVGRITVVTLIEVLRGIEDEKRTEIKGLLEDSFDRVNLDNKVITTAFGLKIIKLQPSQLELDE